MTTPSDTPLQKHLLILKNYYLDLLADDNLITDDRTLLMGITESINRKISGSLKKEIPINKIIISVDMTFSIFKAYDNDNEN